jgi:hypothetical protein
MNNIIVHAAPVAHPPFAVAAILEEQDTCLLLKQQTTLTDPGKPAWFLANKLEQEHVYQLGDVLLKGKNPTRLLAIVHDIEHQPTCSLDSVTKAYHKLSTIVTSERIASIAIPLLGTVHGRIPLDLAITSFQRVFLTNPPDYLEKIWLVLPEDASCECLSLLRNE